MTEVNEMSEANNDAPQLRQYTKTGQVTSELSGKYLTMLAKHFARKVEVEHLSEQMPKQALVHFPMGECVMTADAETLSFAISAHTEEAATMAANIISGHMHLLKKLVNKEIAWVSKSTVSNSAVSKSKVSKVED